MIQSQQFFMRPYWQRLVFGFMLLPIVLLVIVGECVIAAVKTFWQFFKDLGGDFSKHIIHLYRFYRYDVLSPNPQKYLDKPEHDDYYSA